ncbi:translation initiation factor IF-3 [Casimicrobium huifangae]|uniref:translation initiation factor IF-3 n=1 Tax=Casimicrobium huifangae TaxID=2591109 RepID=UPI0012EB0BE1|nr:translation initiation factor IF-3 [Casimicrobium huifangae]HQA34599.1 translation initiation factor IF-3 [Casimicrobium huifangae]
MADKDTRINREITAPEVRLIDKDGEQAGIKSLREAMAMAEDAELDLVEIAPTAQPPVCRIMDYGKFKFQESKRLQEAKSKQKQIEIKEIKLRPQTDEHDYQIKMRKIHEFIAEGDKVKITLRFRGREMAHQEFGVRQLDRIKADTEEICVVEQFPRMEGRLMVMMLAPKKKQVAPAKAAAPAKPAAGASAPAAADGAKAPSTKPAGAPKIAA